MTQEHNAVQAAAKAEVFRFRAPLMAPGGGRRGFFAETKDIRIGWISYCQAGEDDLHQHPNEDHVFFVLKGRMLLRNEAGEETHLGPLEGVLLPAGHVYSFVTEGEEPCVMLRFNGWTDARRDIEERLGVDGAMLERDRDERKKPQDLRIPGRFFPE